MLLIIFCIFLITRGERCIYRERKLSVLLNTCFLITATNRIKSRQMSTLEKATEGILCQTVLTHSSGYVLINYRCSN